MEACIEALFKIEGENGRRKTIEMIRVLKGAISVSKSRTGEVIYHYNRHEKKALRRQLVKYDNDTRRSRMDIEHQKRDILRKWSLVFGRQRNFCESIRGFDEMLAEAILIRDKLKDEEKDCTDAEEEAAAEAEAERVRLEEEEEKQKNAIPQIQDPRKRRLGANFNQNQAGTQPGVPAATTTGMLPKINMNTSLFNGRIETKEEEALRLAQEAEEERKRKQKELPRFDKELVQDYLDEQKSMHEGLLTRNALMKIKNFADNDHVFYKYRMKTRLPGSAQSLLHHIELERPLEPGEVRPPTRLTARPDTRQTVRSDNSYGETRQSVRPDTRYTARSESRQTARPDTRHTARSESRQTVRPDTRHTARSESRQTVRPDTRQTTCSEGPRVRIRPWTKQNNRLGFRQTPRRQGRASLGDVPTESDDDIIAAGGTKGFMTSRPALAENDALPIPKMERAKTVHFS
ncbi:hypothetical protein EGW08_008310 [Elysia chlorotica]|uniref:Uncharacterized protein n=1 Tax=Elysia chlorotica TaxID=188477 RepID=A0A433TQY8_ELYCH|nr:hypothetical protein EGW08_008310 [Elysia chlorotica]